MIAFRDDLRLREKSPAESLGRRAKTRFATRSSLLLRIRHNDDSAAWLEFDKLYRPLMFRYARAWGLSRDDAEDIVQQCLVAITRRISEFAYARDKGGFRAWLHKTVDNAVKNNFRRRGMVQARTDCIETTPTREKSPAEIWETHWQQERLLYFLEQCRSEVTVQTFQAFHLNVIEEWAPETVARRLDISVDKVYRAKARVLRRLREKMSRTDLPE